MRVLIIYLSIWLLTACGLVDENWSQHFYNNSDEEYLFYLHFYYDGKVFHPAYNEISEKPFLNEIKPHSEGWCNLWPTTFRYGTLGHMYAFSPDTLERYSWEEILAKKKYWFTARPCQLEPIQFPEEFEYMGDM